MTGLEKARKTAIWVFTIGAIFCVSVFVVSALVFASAQAHLDGKIRIGTVLKQAKRQFFPCFVSSLIFGLITFLAIILIVVLFVAIYNPFESRGISSGIGTLGVFTDNIQCCSCLCDLLVFLHISYLCGGYTGLGGVKTQRGINPW